MIGSPLVVVFHVGYSCCITEPTPENQFWNSPLTPNNPPPPSPMDDKPKITSAAPIHYHWQLIRNRPRIPKLLQVS